MMSSPSPGLLVVVAEQAVASMQLRLRVSTPKVDARSPVAVLDTADVVFGEDGLEAAEKESAVIDIGTAVDDTGEDTGDTWAAAAAPAT